MSFRPRADDPTGDTPCAWIKVSDRLPMAWDPLTEPEAPKYIVSDGVRVWTEECWIEGGFVHEAARTVLRELPITHWAPLPPPPARDAS